MSAATLTPNVSLLQETLRQIMRNPHAWDQTVWRRDDVDCGTAMCFAGTAAHLNGAKWAYPSDHGNANLIWETWDGEYVLVSARNHAQRALGLNDGQAEWLFNGSNDLDDLRRIVAEITSGVTS